MENNLRPVAALYVRADSIYKKKCIECYDIERDARIYAGPYPVIAHPPCRAWGHLKGLAKPRPGEKDLALLAVQQVFEYGGVLEHPSGSSLFKEPRLLSTLGPDTFFMSVNQHWWGHKAEKRTLLYISGITPKQMPAVSLSLDAITHVVVSSRFKSGRRKSLPELSKAARERTPDRFAEWLIQVALLCRKK